MRYNSNMVVSSVFSIISLLAFSYTSLLFNDQLILYLGILLSLTIFLFFYCILQPASRKVIVIQTSIKTKLIYTITTISVVAVLLIPPFEGSVLEYTRIPALNWFRYLSSLLLTSFLPGYFLLRIVDRERSIRGEAALVMSYLLSLFITFVEGFFILLFGETISSFAPQVVIGIILALLVVYYFTGEKKKESRLVIQLPKTMLLLSILMTVTIGSILIMIYNIPLTPIDTWDIHNYAIIYLNSAGFPVYGGRMVPSYPYAFLIYLSFLISLCGIPSSLAVQFLYVLSFIIVLAFYSMVKQWFKEDKYSDIPIIATFLSILLGFGSIYSIYLNAAKPDYSLAQILSLTTNKTYDIYLRILYLTSFVAPIWSLGLPVFFMLIYLLNVKCKMELKGLLISSLIFLLYFGHLSEAIIFVLLMFIYNIAVDREDRWKTDVFILVSLFIVLIFDCLAPAQNYVFPPDLLSGKPSLNFIYALTTLIVALDIAIYFVKSKFNDVFSQKIWHQISQFITRHWVYIRWLLFYFYFLCLSIWLTLFNDLDVYNYGGPYFTPFFVFPIRFGAVGAIALFTIMAYFPELIKQKSMILFLLLAFLGFGMEQVNNFYPFYTSYRFATFTFIGLCVVAAYGIRKGLDRIW